LLLSNEIKALIKKLASWIALFISAILLQFAGSQTDQYYFKMYQDILTANNILQSSTAKILLAESSEAKQFLPYEFMSAENIQKIKNSIFKGADDPVAEGEPKFKEISNKLKNGSIDLRGYFAEMSAIHLSIAKKSAREYNRRIDDIKQYIDKGTPWEARTNWLLGFQALCLLYIGYSLVRDFKLALRGIPAEKTKLPQKTTQAEDEDKKI
jgi:hypothetical protein